MDYEALMDERQKHVHEHFSPNSKLTHQPVARHTEGEVGYRTARLKEPQPLCAAVFRNYSVSLSAHHFVPDGYFSEYLHCGRS